MKALPAHLADMTQAKWDGMTKAQREAMVDKSDLHPLLSTYVGMKVRVEPKRAFGASTFTVGKTTGWRPALLAMRANSRGSSDLIGADEVFTLIQPVR